MTREELLRIIEDEVSAVAKEPLREPIVERPKPQRMYSPVLKTEEEIDDMLFYAGKREPK